MEWEGVQGNELGQGNRAADAPLDPWELWGIGGDSSHSPALQGAHGGHHHLMFPEGKQSQRISGDTS